MELFGPFWLPWPRGPPPGPGDGGPPSEYLRLANGRCMLPWDGCCLPKDALNEWIVFQPCVEVAGICSDMELRSQIPCRFWLLNNRPNRLAASAERSGRPLPPPSVPCSSFCVAVTVRHQYSSPFVTTFRDHSPPPFVTIRHNRSPPFVTTIRYHSRLCQ